jgi:murein L,D-transpeptidase YcbB/YkuD
MEEGDADPERAADLELLLTDAVAGMLDHVRYGRVRPVSLNATWNVDPREEAPGLDTVLTRIAESASVAEAIEAEKPRHFIYTGLVGALARLREIESQGGWPTVPAGKALKAGASDRRVPRLRARLSVTGELEGGATSDSLLYDAHLQKAVELFQARHRLEPTGVVDKITVEAMNVSVDHRIAQVRVNLERARWVLGGLDNDFLLVNLPAFKAYLIRDGKNVWETRTQIGKEARQTPTFRANMRTVVFNPDWTVPPTILAEDVLEGMRKGENTIAQKQLTIIDKDGREVSPGSIDWDSATPENFPYTLRQPPGDDNALGRVKFLFPNKYSIYLHDTPRQELFEADRRTFSSGCIRVENALDLADRLLTGQDGWGPAKIQDALATGKTQNIAIEHTIPVLIVYWTVSVGASGEIRYMRDVYDLDRPLLAAMNGRA